MIHLSELLPSRGSVPAEGLGPPQHMPGGSSVPHPIPQTQSSAENSKRWMHRL